ncbi:hypothetical protein BDZ89DRAFT_1060001 [Hymenopellis radicata]|nr:hypothetical protein BDZ89DRAFT_1060001 [Hymenopellis radicata]
MRSPTSLPSSQGTRTRAPTSGFFATVKYICRAIQLDKVSEELVTQGAIPSLFARSVLRPQYATVLGSIPFLLPRCPYNLSMSSNEMRF